MNLHELSPAAGANKQPYRKGTNMMISPICQILSLCKQLPLLFYDIPLPWYCQRAFFVTFCRICPFYFFRTTLVFYV